MSDIKKIPSYTVKEQARIAVKNNPAPLAHLAAISLSSYYLREEQNYLFHKQ